MIASLGLLFAASAAHAQTATLGASDFTVALSANDSSGKSHLLSADELTNLLPLARCSCPITLTAAVEINSDSLANVTSSDTFSAQVMVGSNCDNPNVTTCVSLGSPLTLNAGTASQEQTFLGSNLLTAAANLLGANGGSCSSLTTAITTTVWAIIRQNGVLLASQPSVAVGVGGGGPTPPTAPQAVSAESGFSLTWTPPATITSLQGYQVLCSPAPATAPSAAFDSCAAGTLPAGTAPFATLDPTLVCSALVSIGTNNVRVKGLQDGTTYQVAVVSINADGTPSAISDITTVTPQPTLGFDDLYKNDGGSGLVACAVGGSEPRGSGLATAALCALALLLVARRRRRRPRPRVRSVRRARWLRAAQRSGLALMLVAAVAQTARASDEEDPDRISHGYRFGEEPEKPAWSPSPRNWNFELRFGPYYPAVDTEFSDRGSAARPFEQTFGSKQRLFSGLELDRQILHRGGTWSVGLGFGFYRATASSLAADMVTRTGDETSLKFYQLALLATYRADFLHERYSSPVVPYAKAGLDCAIWSVSNSGKSTSTLGRTLGWNAGAGIALDLSFIDPEGMRTMDSETGVNGISLFGEFTYLGLNGFGSSSALRLGDTTWVAGLMMEM